MENKKHIILRSLDGEKMSVRSGDDGKRFIEGYAIIFNQRSKLIREWGEVFYEVIEPSAPDNVLADGGLNVIATIDHNRSKMLGRTKSGTLVLTKDSRGLKYTIELPNTTLGNDIAEMIERGDYFESSFIFTVAEKGCRYDNSEEIPVRYVSNFERMYDVAIVIDGAYANTAVGMRSQEFELGDQPTTAERTLGAIESAFGELDDYTSERLNQLTVSQFVALLREGSIELEETEPEKVARLLADAESKDKSIDQLQRQVKFYKLSK